jgi:hypothetical protein
LKSGYTTKEPKTNNGIGNGNDEGRNKKEMDRGDAGT